MRNVLNFKYSNGNRTIFPDNSMVKNWVFEDGQEDEATLCKAIADVAEKNGMNANDLHRLFPAILRMLKSDIEWAEQNKS